MGSKATLEKAVAPTAKQPPHTTLERDMRVPERALSIHLLKASRLDQWRSLQRGAPALAKGEPSRST